MPQLFGFPVPKIVDDIAHLSAWLTVLTVIFVPLERLFAAHPQKILRKGILTDLAYYFMSGIVPMAILSVPLAMMAWVVHRTVPPVIHETISSLPLGVRACLGLVVGEIGYYWGHRLSHEIPFLWRFHSIHHSAEEMDFMVSSRAHPVDMLVSRISVLVPIYILGLDGPTGSASGGSNVAIFVAFFTTVWGFFVHANVWWRLGPIEWLISSPAFHHWHHTLHGPINVNYSSTLPWLDRLFGSHYLPDKLPDAYGIKAKVPDDLVDQLFYPLFPIPEPASEVVQDVVAFENVEVPASPEASTPSVVSQ